MEATRITNERAVAILKELIELHAPKSMQPVDFANWRPGSGMNRLYLEFSLPTAVGLREGVTIVFVFTAERNDISVMCSSCNTTPNHVFLMSDLLREVGIFAMKIEHAFAGYVAEKSYTEELRLVSAKEDFRVEIIKAVRAVLGLSLPEAMEKLKRHWQTGEPVVLFTSSPNQVAKWRERLQQELSEDKAVFSVERVADPVSA